MDEITRKSAPLADMHPADVIARLRKLPTPTSLRQLALAHDYQAGSLRSVLRGQWPAAERIVADALGVHPQTIWPSRYTADGQSTRRSRSGRPKSSTVNGQFRAFIENRSNYA